MKKNYFLQQPIQFSFQMCGFMEFLAVNKYDIHNIKTNAHGN